MIWLAAGITAIALSGNRVISAGLDGTVRSEKVIASRPYQLYAVAASGKHLAFCGDSPNVDLDDHTIKLPAGWCLSLAFSPDAGTLAVGTSEKQVLLFDVAGAKPKRTLETKWSSPAVAWSPDGKTIAAGAFYVVLWNSADGTKLRSLDVDDATEGVAFSPDGSLVAGVGRDKVVRIWNASSGQVVRTIEPEGFVQFVGDKTAIEPIRVPMLAVDFSPDGKTIATGGSDRMVRLWDVDSGKELRRFEGHHASITALRFLPDGKRLVSASLDGTLRFWNLP